MISTTLQDRLYRARVSLDGLSVGDALGGFFEGTSYQRLSVFVKERRPPEGHWRFTDDTMMALSIYEILAKHGEIDQDALAASYGEHYELGRGYGPAMHRLLPQIKRGKGWRTASSALFSGQGSFGNGGAMRVAPLGAYFADDLNKVIEQARLATEITHAHPEGIIGATAVALGAAYACCLKAANERPSRTEFINLILPHLPDSDVKSGIKRAAEIQSTEIVHVVGMIGNGSQISAQDTVPFVLFCAGEWLDNYEEAIWQTASGGGDVDTTCAMVGGIVASYTGREAIPQAWLNSREPLPKWAIEGNDL